MISREDSEQYQSIKNQSDYDYDFENHDNTSCLSCFISELKFNGSGNNRLIISQILRQLNDNAAIGCQ